MFIARKFDPLFNSELINNVDQSIFGLYSASNNTYCQIISFKIINNLICRFQIITILLGEYL